MWGGLYGVYLIVERIPSLWRTPTPLDEQPRWQQTLGGVRTFLFVTLAWLPFRMELPIAASYLRGLFLWKRWDLFSFKQVLLGKSNLSVWTIFKVTNPLLLFLLAAAVLFDLLQHHSKTEEFLLRWPRWSQVIFILIFLLVALLAFFSDAFAPFVYQAF